MSLTTQMRCFAPRELLPLLLAPPAVESASGRQGNPHIQRIAARLRRGDVATIPACEMRQIFSVMAEECRYSDGTCIARERDGDRSPRKLARRCSNNNMHALMKFVERTIDRRYMKQQRCKCEDEQFLDDELRGSFGTEEASFRAEEDVLCLAFEMAANAIRQSCGGDGDGLPSVLTVHAVSSSGAIQTALQIIDSVVLISKHERAAVKRLQLAKKKGDQSFKAKSGDRRSKYGHLLRPSERSRISDSDPPPEEKSIMEERYPKQWEWLHRFRARGESTCESEAELQQSHFPTANPQIDNLDDEDEKSDGGQFVIVRRKTPTLDDISVSSDEIDDDMNLEGVIPCDDRKEGESPLAADTEVSLDNVTSPPPEPATAPTAPEAEAASPYDKLDKEARELRLALLDMPPGESTSAEAVQHTVDEIGSLLARYGELDGAAGIARCGDMVGGIERSEESTHRFPLNDAVISALVKDFLTDAMGALRAKAFLRSFVLPLLIEMNPTACAASIDSVEEMEKAAKAKGKAASRSLTSLLATLARDRPTECVISLVVPSLVLRKYLPSVAPEMENLFEPARFQCELISRILRGRDALSAPAVATLIEQVLPVAEGTSSDVRTSRGGMKWTEHSMPLLTACLNRQPTLSDEVVAKLAEEIMFHMSPKAPQSMAKSMKFSSLFHALVMKYGAQLQSTGRVEHLKDAAGRLKTFMSKTIGLSLKKLS
ncbi:hypothetical protein ACHAXT_000293 [Thalassiosira profunda]